MRIKWTECAGRIIESGQQPRFVDFLQFLKLRAMLVNNEFGEDFNCSPSRNKKKAKAKTDVIVFPTNLQHQPQVYIMTLRVVNTEVHKE